MLYAALEGPLFHGSAYVCWYCLGLLVLRTLDDSATFVIFPPFRIHAISAADPSD